MKNDHLVLLKKSIGLLCMGLFFGTCESATVRYMMWDASQVPAYRQCAANFQKQNPDIQIKIRQAGWDDYWTAISTGFISDTAPDVFVNHLSKYPEIVSNDLLLNLRPLMIRDQFKQDLEDDKLLKTWMRQDQLFGLPKDWDTVALIVNLTHAQKQGITLTELQNMDWNPHDGGSFERIAKRLSLDVQGHNASSALFNPKKIQIYGYQTPGAGGMTGQTEWSHFAVSNGYRFQVAPWSPELNYDQPALAETMTYLAGLPNKGISAPVERTRSLGATAMFVSQRAAMIPDGSWMINFYKDNAHFQYAWVPLPKGPKGYRASMLNGTADSIWIGSKVKAQAWLWVKYLASSECQQTVARHGIVFPAVRGGADTAMQNHRQKGIDTSAFLTMSQSQTFPPPIVDKASQINEVVGHSMESILMRSNNAKDALESANQRLKQLLRK